MGRTFCGEKAILTSLLVLNQLEITNRSIKPTVARLSYVLHDSSISRDPHLLTIMAAPIQLSQSSHHRYIIEIIASADNRIQSGNQSHLIEACTSCIIMRNQRSKRSSFEFLILTSRNRPGGAKLRQKNC